MCEEIVSENLQEADYHNAIAVLFKFQTYDFNIITKNISSML